MSKLLSSQLNKLGHVKHFCPRCLNHFPTQERLDMHMEYCNTHEAVTIEMPEEGTTLSFKNYNRSMRVKRIVYADFESFIKLIDTRGPNPKNSYTKQYQKHTPPSFCYYIQWRINNGAIGARAPGPRASRGPQIFNKQNL